MNIKLHKQHALGFLHDLLDDTPMPSKAALKASLRAKGVDISGMTQAAPGVPAQSVPAPQPSELLSDIRSIRQALDQIRSEYKKQTEHKMLLTARAFHDAGEVTRKACEVSQSTSPERMIAVSQAMTQFCATIEHILAAWLGPEHGFRVSIVAFVPDEEPKFLAGNGVTFRNKWDEPTVNRTLHQKQIVAALRRKENLYVCKNYLAVGIRQFGDQTKVSGLLSGMLEVACSPGDAAQPVFFRHQRLDPVLLNYLLGYADALHGIIGLINHKRPAAPPKGIVVGIPPESAESFARYARSVSARSELMEADVSLAT